MAKASLSTTHQPETGLIRRTVNKAEGYTRSKTEYCPYKAAFCSSYTSPQQQPDGSVRAAQQQRNDSTAAAQQHLYDTFTAP